MFLLFREGCWKICLACRVPLPKLRGRLSRRRQEIPPIRLKLFTLEDVAITMYISLITVPLRQMLAFSSRSPIFLNSNYCKWRSGNVTGFKVLNIRLDGIREKISNTVKELHWPMEFAWEAALVLRRTMASYKDSWANWGIDQASWSLSRN